MNHHYREHLSSFFYSEARLQYRNLELIIENKDLQEALQVEDIEKLPLQDDQAIAQSYSGMQFGHFTTLGDGRAILLGEKEVEGKLYDIVLKGSGRTPYSRGGDGKASLSPMLREYLISEAMHYLGVSTSRSLAVFKTGEEVYRQSVEEGALLVRVMTSHIRVGTFQHAYYRGGEEKLEEILHYTKERLYPGTSTLDFLEQVMDRQAALIAKWVSLGFIHGVMNTDNMSISGESFDYGPCAFIDEYDPGAVFSSIDTQGRYAYWNQPSMGLWNLTRLAETLLDVLKNEGVSQKQVEELLQDYERRFKAYYREEMALRLGICDVTESDDALIDTMLSLLTELKMDYHNFFLELEKDQVEEDAFQEWIAVWKRRKNAPMKNPQLVPRNHLVDRALKEAEAGDLTFFNALLERVRRPYDAVEAMYQEPMPETMKKRFRTYCGT